ncbi:MAG: hypothetical protein HUJ98_07060, partial [Bacteroidaceae bacterium]|nr:hypothetical protein [Bacteroidaceae bacterium]
MNGTYLICSIILFGGFAYYCYKRRKALPAPTKEELVQRLANTLQAEMVENLVLNDVVSYFKSFQLKKGVDTPFIAVTNKGGIKSYVLATYNETTATVNHGRLISPNSIDDDFQNLIG